MFPAQRDTTTNDEANRATPEPSWEAERKRERDRGRELRRARRLGAYRRSNLRLAVSVAFDIYFAWRVIAFFHPLNVGLLVLAEAPAAAAVSKR